MAIRRSVFTALAILAGACATRAPERTTPGLAVIYTYVASDGRTRSAIAGSVINSQRIAVREIASWTTEAGGAHEQSALAVYEFEAGLVRRVSYFPATK